MVTEPIEKLRKELAYSADTDGAIKRIDASAFALFTGCLAAALAAKLDLAEEMALGLKSLKSAIEFLEGTRYGTEGGGEGG